MIITYAKKKLTYLKLIVAVPLLSETQNKTCNKNYDEHHSYQCDRDLINVLRLYGWLCGGYLVINTLRYHSNSCGIVESAWPFHYSKRVQTQ